MIHVRTWGPEGLREGGLELLPAPTADVPLVWVDVQGPTEAELTSLGERFGLHRLEIEDCLHLDQRPKLEEYPGHHFLVMQGFSPDPTEQEELVLHELHLFIGARWLLTVHEKASEAVAYTQARLKADAQSVLGKGADHLAYVIIDALVDQNFPVLDRFSDALDVLEEQIFERPTPSLLQQAFVLKRNLVQVRRVLSPQRDVVGMLAKGGVAHVSDRTTVYFRDVYDHLVRLYEQIDAARDLVGNAMDVYLSVVANRTNDVTKQLTIFASIFMPLSFIVGFFGQNFDVLGQPPFFVAMLTATTLLPVGMIFWFRRQGWW